MVGVPGRSKGCITCRRRKVKCDERKPTCMRCEKSSLHCDGYRIAVRASRSSASEGKQRASSRSTTDSSDSSDDSIQRSPYMWPFLEEMSASYFIRNFFSQKSSIRVHSRNSEWLESCFAPGSDALARKSASCLAMGFFAGAHHEDGKIMRYSERQYEDAVRGLAKRLESPSASCYDNSLLCAAMALYSWEVLLRPDASGWIRHAGGISKFIELRGPECHQHYPEHSMFMWASTRILASAFLERSRTFLEREEWLTVPWQVHPENISSERELWELRVIMPGIWQDIEEWERLQDPELLPVFREPDRRLQLVGKLRHTFQRLFRWRFQWEENHGDCTSERPASSVANMASDIPRPDCLGTALWFDDPFRCVEIVHYQTLCSFSQFLGVRLFEPYLLQQVLSELEDAPPQTGVLTLPHPGLTTTEQFCEMARTIEYMLSRVGISAESFPMFSSIRICIVISAFLLQNNQLTTWMMEVVNRISDRCGFKGLARLTKLEPPVADFEDSPAFNQAETLRAHFLPLEAYGAGYLKDII